MAIDYDMTILRAMAMQAPDPAQVEYTTVARLLGVVAPAEEPAAPTAGVLARSAGWIKTAAQRLADATWRASVTVEGSDLHTLLEAAQRRARDAGFVVTVQECGVDSGVRPTKPKKTKAKPKA